jgi:hypothetical protein
VTEAGDDVVSRETMRHVARARARAAEGPSAEELSRLLSDLGRRRADMSPDDIRALGGIAIRQAQRVSYLLGQLAGLLGEAGEDGA